MCTPYQFQVVSSFPEHEKKFLQWKDQARRETKKKGSYHAFHGSPITNWHSIIRTGTNSLAHSLAIPIYLSDSHFLGYWILYLVILFCYRTSKWIRSWYLYGPTSLLLTWIYARWPIGYSWGMQILSISTIYSSIWSQMDVFYPLISLLDINILLLIGMETFYV